MKTVKISLNSIDKVKAFVNEVTKYDAEFDLVSGRYVIDAKSIMGIFSLDLSKPIDLNIHSENNVDEILAKLAPHRRIIISILLGLLLTRGGSAFEAATFFTLFSTYHTLFSFIPVSHLLLLLFRRLLLPYHLWCLPVLSLIFPSLQYPVW